MPSASGSAYMSPWRRLDGDARGLELDARQAQHFRRAVDPDRLRRARAEQLDHPPGAGADVEQPAERSRAERSINRALDLAFGDMERADLVPDPGMGGEIAAGRFGALGADRLGPRGVGGEQRVGGIVGPCVDQREQRRDAARSASVRNTQLPSLRRSSTPASARIFKWRDTRGWLWPSTCASSPTDNSIRRSKREDAQPGRVGKRLEAVGERKRHGHEIRI